jgi:uncharacterized protein YndB with AHSA1/START domain
MAETRSILKEIFVDAPPAVVWDALTLAEELERWFPLRARVEGGADGRIWLSWGEGAEAEAPISVWEPERRFGWAMEFGGHRLAVDFHLEAKDGGTVLRLVHSGFDASAEWDAEYHMTVGGWSYFLENLRVYLERHRGVGRDLLWVRRVAAVPGPEAYDRLVRVIGLDAQSGLVSLEGGAQYDAMAHDGIRLEGRVIVCQPGMQLGVTVENLDDALLFLEMELHASGSRPAVWLSTYGLEQERVARLRSWLERVYTEALPEAAAT